MKLSNMSHIECAKNKKTYLKSKKDYRRKIKIAKRSKDVISINIFKNELEEVNVLYKGCKKIHHYFLKYKERK